MATVVLTQHPIGAPFSGTIHNNNLQLIENSFADLGPYVISGLTFSAGTGLSVSVVAGTASIGGRVTVASTFVIAGLVDATTNHIYLLNTGAGTSNTTGTPPANSVKLGTAVTAGGVVTVVAMGRTSGRQQFQQPQNLVLGGPSAGTASAGHPRAGNLAQWNATQAEGFEFFGTLPAGAVPTSFSGDVTLTPATSSRNVVQATSDTAIGLTVKDHSASSSVSRLELLDSTGVHGVKVDQLGNITTDYASGTYGQFGKLSMGNLGAGASEMGIKVEAGQSLRLTAGNSIKINTPTIDGQSVTTFINFRGPSDFTSNSSSETSPPLLLTNNNVAGPVLNVAGGVSVRVGCWRGAGQLEQWGNSSTSTNRQLTGWVPTFVDATDATRKARAVFNIYDTAAREALRLEASGTAAMIGFLGAAAVVRQTAAAASTDLATVITLANSLRTGLIANGLFA